ERRTATTPGFAIGRRVGSRGEGPGRGRGGTLPEVDGTASPRTQLPDQVVHRPDLGVERGGTDADEAHEVGVAPAEPGVAVPSHELAHPVVLALLAAPAQGLDGDHPVERPARLLWRAHS